MSLINSYRTKIVRPVMLDYDSLKQFFFYIIIIIYNSFKFVKSKDSIKIT